jgi:hypothetical protein
MVKNVRGVTFAAGALAVLICLAGCNLGTGIFPDRLMSYEAFADLTRFIDPGHIWNYEFQIVRDSTSGAEYLVLASDDGSWGDDCVLVFDSYLKVLGHFTMDQLDSMDAVPFSGRGAMVDEAGRIVVGNRRFSVGTRALTYQDSPAGLWTRGLAIPLQPTPNLANIYGSGTTLMYDRYLPDWTFWDQQNPNIGGGNNKRLAYIGLTDTAVVVLTVNDAPDAEIYQFTPAAFAAGTPAGAPSIVALNPYYIYWDESLGMTEDETGTISFAAFSYDYNLDKREYVRFDVNGAPIGDNLPVRNMPWEQKQVYGRRSGWFIFDKKEMTLVRRAWWWQ